MPEVSISPDDDAVDDDAVVDAPPPVPVLLEPSEGTPEPLTTTTELADAVAAFAAGTGPVAADAERASGYRYSQRAYLVQLRREGAGTILIDPIALPDLSSLDAVLTEVEWVFHAASQDLACLAEVGLRPRRLFDTELAGRLLGYERVGLATMTERVLGVGLVKGHSAADWSTRPLPPSWLVYAALDVELLLALRNRLEAELHDTGKSELAAQEFQAVLDAPPAPPRMEPWRRLSGIHKLRNRRQLALARAMWESRDARARERDVAPGRVLPDSALLAAVRSDARDLASLTVLPVLSGPRMRRTAPLWLAALEDGRAVADAELPATSAALDGPPTASRWAEKDPAAAARLTRVRAALLAVADYLNLPVENLLEPALSRRVTWEPPEPLTIEAIAAALAAGRARPWQIDATALPIHAALTAPEPAPAEPAAVEPSGVEPAAPEPTNAEPGVDEAAG